jgi:cytochrome P450
MIDFKELYQAAQASHAWADRLFFLCSVLVGVCLFYILSHAFYNLYLHPLRKYPGPRTWIAFPILRSVASMRGLLDKELRQLHKKHGDVVRFSANQVSFITAQAWRDIYGHGHRQLQKPVVLKDANRASDIIIANDADHTRFRKALAHGFSEKAMHQQEPLIKVYIDLLIEKLRDVATSGAKTDMVKWYNLTTFDMIGDLAFGTSFEGLKNNRLHAWVTTIFSSIKLNVFLRFARQYPILAKLPMLLLLRKLQNARTQHRGHVRDTVMRRVNDPDLQGRGDFMDAMQKHKGGPDGLSTEELVTNANVLIIAGSETTATLLSGVTYLLLKNPTCLRKVTWEVRGAFENEDEINFVNASTRLTYMLACLDEAFRMYPPVPAGLQRVVPPGEPIEISGYEMAPGVSAVWSTVAAILLPVSVPYTYFPTRPLCPYTNLAPTAIRPISPILKNFIRSGGCTRHLLNSLTTTAPSCSPSALDLGTVSVAISRITKCASF